MEEKNLPRHMSLDIETLATTVDAAVIAIGAVVFTAEDILDKFEVLISPLLTPGHRDLGTYKWWRSQDRDIFNRMVSGVVTPWDATTRFSAFCTLDISCVWGNPVSFDVGILRILYQKCGMEFPFEFWRERDLSTLKWMAKQDEECLGAKLKEIRAEHKNPHDALSDAITQAKMIQACMRAYGLN